MYSGGQPGIMTPYHQVYQPVSPKKKPSWLIPVIIGGVVLILVVVLVVVFSMPSGNKDEVDYEEVSTKDREAIEDIYDEFADAEVLNDEYKQAVQNTERVDYKTTRESTKYATYTVKDICSYYYAYCSNNFKDIDDYKKVPALNSNALDFYLDNDFIVLMLAKYDDTDKVYGTVIFSRSGAGIYNVFDTENTEMSLMMSRAQIFNDVVGVPTFYVLE